MAVLAGSFLGLVLGSALLGALFAWILRRALPIPLVASYAVGTAAMTGVYAFAGAFPPAPFDRGAAFLGFNLAGGALAFALLWLTAGRRKGAAGKAGA